MTRCYLRRCRWMCTNSHSSHTSGSFLSLCRGVNVRGSTYERVSAIERRKPARFDDEMALISAAKCGDEGASATLVARYRGFVRCKARSYFLAGADRDDVFQEGLIGLFKAIRDYDPVSYTHLTLPTKRIV